MWPHCIEVVLHVASLSWGDVTHDIFVLMGFFLVTPVSWNSIGALCFYSRSNDSLYIAFVYFVQLYSVLPGSLFNCLNIKVSVMIFMSK